MAGADRTTVRFLLRSVDAPGGVARSVLTVAGALATRYDVEVVSLFRRRDRPRYPVPAGVRLRYLEDHRGGPAASRRQGPLRARVLRRLTRPLRRRPSSLFSPADPVHRAASLHTDLVLARAVRSMRSGVLVTTRPSLHAAAARLAPRGLALVAVEHMNAATRPRALVDVVVRRADRLQALVVLTERDAVDWRRVLGSDGPPVEVVPNAVPWDLGHDGRARARVVVAAGRLTHQKGFDRLVRAWAKVRTDHPDWRLVVHGEGPGRPRLERLVRRLGVDDVVALPGWTGRMADVLAEASVFALSSRFEGLPVVALEAMGRGTPVVAFDCPRGPRELIDDGVDGLLVDDGDVDGFASALSRLLTDEELRQRLGAAALVRAEQYARPTVAARWAVVLDRALDRAPS